MTLSFTTPHRKTLPLKMTPTSQTYTAIYHLTFN